MMVQLEEREWQQVMSILAQQPWHIANPLLMKIGEQLQRQQPPSPSVGRENADISHGDAKGNSGAGAGGTPSH